MVATLQPGYPGDTGDLIITVAELTETAEGHVMKFFAHMAGEDLDQADWANRRTPDLAKIRRDLDGTIAKLERSAGPQIHELIGEAYRRGHGNAPLPATIVRREQGLLAELRAAWRGMRRSALRFWNRVMGVGSVQRDEQARRMAVQREFDLLAQRGIIGHWDSHGRPYAVVPHVSQILRDTARDAYLDGYFDKVLAHGGDLVVVPVNATACPLCEPWQGRVLSISGLDPDRPSILDARLAGLWHPNCRHPVSAWHPGQTVRFRVPRGASRAYKAAQRQRAIESHIRHWTLREAVALDPITKAAAARKVRYWHRAMGQHIATHGHAPRRPRRVGR